jgi:hypothetical protein
MVMSAEGAAYMKRMQKAGIRNADPKNGPRCTTCGNIADYPDQGPYGPEGLEDTHIWSYCQDPIHDDFHENGPADA